MVHSNHERSRLSISSNFSLISNSVSYTSPPAGWSEEQKANLRKVRPVDGKNSPSYDNTCYRFIHPTYGEEYCTRYELAKKYAKLKMTTSSLYALLIRKYNNVKGWSIIWE
jgi:hypothetical protein